MRAAAVRSFRNIRSAFRHQRNCYSSAIVRRRCHLIESNSSSVHRLPDNAEIHRFLFPAIFTSRALSMDAAAKFNVTEVNRAGPLVEYEHRIAAGELVDGDACQE